MQHFETKADFARRMGWNRSSVTRFAKAGRLVVLDGLVDVAASLIRLAETAGKLPCHAAQRDQLARARNRKLVEAQKESDAKRKNRERAARRRKTEAYRAWWERSRELRRSLKEKYRRQAGAKPRIEIMEAARKRKLEKSAEISARLALDEMMRAEFVGPVPPSKKDDPSGYFTFRYRTDPNFREKEKARVAAKKATVPMYYARQMLGIGAIAPDELVEAKRLQLLIKKHIRSEQDEKH